MEVCDIIPYAIWSYQSVDKILGFDTLGTPILPSTAKSSDPDVIRREKIGWEEIATQAAKIVSFIGEVSLSGWSILTGVNRFGWS
jgi:hypothetical protein